MSQRTPPETGVVGVTFSNEDGRGEVRARCSEQLERRVEAFADQHDKSKSAVIRDALNDYLPDDAAAGPEDPALRDTYHWLCERADDYGQIDAQAATTGLAQALSMKEQFIKRSRLDPLRRKEWIEATFGTIWVRMPEDREALGGDGDGLGGERA